MKYGSESGGVWYIALRVEWVWNMALRVEVCVEYCSESGGVWNMALRVVKVCGI